MKEDRGRTAAGAEGIGCAGPGANTRKRRKKSVVGTQTEKTGVKE